MERFIRTIRPFWPLVAVLVPCLLVELTLLLGDLRVISGPRFRQNVYEYAAFWPGLLRNWQPNYLLQPYAMFVTYAFLHGGLLHLAVNMTALWNLGRGVLERVGPRGFFVLYGVSALGGGLGFGLLANTLRPMVGASGALFGLAGGLVVWSSMERRALHESLWPVARVVLYLIGLNVVLWWVLDGMLAWQTHLGGFLAGAGVACLLRPIEGPDPADP